jgi:hypothetical protein
MKVYLGDGVYAQINEADQLVLTTEDGIKVYQEIFLEREVVASLLAYLTSAGRI